MKVSFEFTTENENRSTMLLVAEFCNALARNVAQPVLSSTVEPETEKQPIKTVAEIIAAERAKTASMKAKAPAVEEPEQISEETAAEAEKPKQKSRKKAEAVAKRTEEKEAAEKLEAERQAEADRLTAGAAKLEAKRVAEEATAATEEAAAVNDEATKKDEAAAPEQTPLTIKDCRDLAMQALNKQRKDLIQEAFAKVGCPNFPTLEKKPEMFDTFMEHIKSGLNE
jgi:type IV secretory pathway VirB10-like protein